MGADGAAVESQGAETQGAENGGGSGLYDQFLEGTPEDLRPYVTDAFKQWDSQITPKLQEAAQLREKFGPLAEIEGLSDVPADELKELIEFRQILGDPDALGEWVDQINAALGRGELSEEDWLAMGEQNGWFEGSEPQQQSPEDIAQKVIEMLQPELEPVKKFMGTQEQQHAAAEQRQQFEGRLSELLPQLGDLDDDARQEATSVIVDLAYRYLDDDDPIGKGFERYRQITGAAQGALVDDKLGQPKGALNGGRPATSPEALSWNNGTSPKEAALARLKQA